MRRIAGVVLGAGCLLGALACGDEDPTGVGSGLIGENVRTFEVVLEAETFLAADTTFPTVGELFPKPFRLVARDFGGERDAHTLVRLNRPVTVSYVDTADVSQTDTIGTYREARLTLIVDTLGTTGGPIELEVLDVTEPWLATHATWTTRLDTAGAEAWTTPGGTTGEVRGSATWTGGDTLVITIDSAAAAVWTDSAAAQQGALIRATTPGALIRIDQIQFEWDVLPRADDLHPDSAAVAGSAGATTTVVDPPPPPPPADELRVGGTPAWRSILNLQPLEDLMVPCDDDGSCMVPLREAAINLATLVLTPTEGGAFRPERPIRLEGRAVLTAPDIAVTRSPLTAAIARMADSIDVSIFEAPPPPDARVEVPITGYIRQLVQPGPNEEQLEWLAIVSAAEGAARSSTLGYATFGSLESAAPPRLRLVLTVPLEVVQ